MGGALHKTSGAIHTLPFFFLFQLYLVEKRFRPIKLKAETNKSSASGGQVVQSWVKMTQG